MIALIDYGGGNTKSVANILERLQISYKITNNPEVIDKSDKIILPGVANFTYCMEQLINKKLDLVIKNEILNKKKLFLGICSGMQLLGSFSEEGNTAGLNLISGTVRKFKIEDSKIVPHVGWNKINHNGDDLLKNIGNNSRFYFCHSFYFDPEDKSNIIINSKYGKNFCSGIKKNNIYGIQFHPEKSLEFGKILIHNFSQLS